MATIGRVLLIPKGDYSGATTYNQLDWVRYGGKAWVCKVDGTVNVTPVQGANWQLLAQDGSGGGGSSDWDDISYKPFDTIDTTTDFTVDNLDNNKLHIKRDTFGTVRVVSGGTTTDLEASGDSIIEIDAGTNVTITADDSSNPKKITINSTGGGGGASIDDTTTALDKTWSSSKINAELGNKADSSDVPTISVSGHGTASASVTHEQQITINSVANDIDGTKYMEYTANSATFTFTNAAILTTSAIDVYTDTWGDNPSDVSVPSNGTCVVTFSSAQTRTVRIYIR